MGDVLSQDEIDALLNASAGFDEEPAPPRGLGSGGARSPGMHQTGTARQRGRLRNVRNPDEVTIAPAVFQPLSTEDETSDQTNLELILDTDLEISAELGSAVRTVREILELGPGSVIELNRLSGEPVDLFVNRRSFSRGEVVVIADSFGIRVTDILSVEERIEALGPG
ncbi:MAG: FliM/FliN family flagellar motor switch protein [bacterium]